MNRDPTVVRRAKVGAELIAEVINGFVEPISWKTLVCCPVLFYSLSSCHSFLTFSPPQAFTLSSLAFMTVFVNSLLSLFRSRLSTPEPAPIQQQQLYPLPTHPSHGFSWRNDDEAFKTPSSRRRRLENGAAAKIS